MNRTTIARKGEKNFSQSKLKIHTNLRMKSCIYKIYFGSVLCKFKNANIVNSCVIGPHNQSVFTTFYSNPMNCFSSQTK